MDCLPIPQFCLDFPLRSKPYLRERPPSASKHARVCGETGLHTLQDVNNVAARYKVLSSRCHTLFAPLPALSNTQY